MIVLRSKVLQELGTVTTSEGDGSSLDARLVMKESSESSQLGLLLEREIHGPVVTIGRDSVVWRSFESIDDLVWHAQEIVGEVPEAVHVEGANDGVEGPHRKSSVEGWKECCRRNVECHDKSNHHGFLSRGEGSKVGRRSGHLERRVLVECLAAYSLI